MIMRITPKIVMAELLAKMAWELPNVELNRAVGFVEGILAHNATTTKVKFTTQFTAALKAQTATLTAHTKKLSLSAAAAKAKAGGMAILKTGLTAASLGFKKLTAVMLANPIGLIVAGVAALAAGIAYLVIRLNRVSDEYRAVQAEVEALTERQNELTEASAAAAGQFTENITGLKNQKEHYRGLADSIAYLSSKQELSAGEMELLKRHIEELNGSVPGLNMAFDEQAGALNVTVEAMNAYLAVAEKRALLDAKMEEELCLRFLLLMTATAEHSA
jgi:hypothetical protein